MYLRKNWLFMTMKALLALLGAYAVGCHMTADRWSDFNYYTVLSNTACLVYFAASLAVNAMRMYEGKHTRTWKPRIEGAVVFCITVTMIVYHAVLRPEAFRMGDGASFYSPLNIVQHYAVPLLALLDWLLLSPKGRWHRHDPAAWMLIPLLYFVYILIRAPFAGDIGASGSPYPYGFIDVQALGVGVAARNALLAAAGMLALAYLLYFVDRMLALAGRALQRRSKAGQGVSAG